LAFLVSTFIENASTASTFFSITTNKTKYILQIYLSLSYEGFSYSASLGFIIFLVGSIVQGFANIVFRSDTPFGWRLLFSFFPFAILAKGLRV
jgi:hypothetical protein